MFSLDVMEQLLLVGTGFVIGLLSLPACLIYLVWRAKIE